jgi:glycosyltransferase involved in cell wall biosynthesis
MKIAYLTAQYPKVSHSFVRREILGLELLGHSVFRVSVRPCEIELAVDPADRRERERTLVLLGSRYAFARLACAFSRRLVRDTLNTFKTAFNVMREGATAGNGLLRPGAYLLEASYLLEVLTREDVEHVHVHFGTNAASVAWIVQRLGGPRFSMTVHGPAEWDAPERHQLREKFAAAAFTVLISSHAIAKAKQWAEPNDWNRFHQVHCSVEEIFFESAQPITQSDTFRLVCVGRLETQKAPLTLIEAFAQLVDSGVDAELVIAGDGTQRRAVEASILRHRLDDRVTLVGWATEEEVREHILASHCFVLPSFAEGLPVAIMEAMALRRPVVSTFVGGIPELVRPNETGWLVPAGDVSALASCLQRVASFSIAELNAIGSAGAERVLSRHSTDIEVAKMEQLLLEAVSH